VGGGPLSRRPPRAPDLAAIACVIGHAEIPGLKMSLAAPWGRAPREVAKASCAHLIVHQTRGRRLGRGGAQGQGKNRRGSAATGWVRGRNDGTVVVLGGAKDLVAGAMAEPGQPQRNKYLAKGPTFRQVGSHRNSIGVELEFAGNYPDVTRGATEAAGSTGGRILVRPTLRARLWHRWVERGSKRPNGSTTRMRSMAKAARWPLGTRQWGEWGLSFRGASAKTNPNQGRAGARPELTVVLKSGCSLQRKHGAWATVDLLVQVGGRHDPKVRAGPRPQSGRRYYLRPESDLGTGRTWLRP